MTYKGHVQNNQVILEPGISLPDGMEVLVEPVVPAAEGKGEASLLHRLGGLVGSAEGLPEDLAANHDHYIGE